MSSPPDLEYSPYACLPLIEVEVLQSMDDLRREHSRTHRNWPLRLVDDSGACHELALKVVRADSGAGPEGHRARLMDASSNGLSICSVQGLDLGDWVTVAGVRQDNGSLLFREDYQVCNLRRRRQDHDESGASGSRKRPFVFGMGTGFLENEDRQPEFVYGLRCELGTRPGSWVFQTLLQSIYFNHLQKHCEDFGKVPPWWKKAGPV